MRILINNEEVLCDSTLEITEQMLSTSSTILKNCYPATWELTKDYTSNYYFPEDYSKVEIYQGENLIFCGVVKKTGNIDLNPRHPHFCDLQVIDFKTFLSEGETLDFVIANKTVSEAIQQVIEAVSDYGFVLGNIQILEPNEMIGAYSTQEKTAYDVFQYLADITQSRWSTRVIDENTVAVDFYDPTLMPEANEIDSTEEYYEDNNIVDITYNYSANDYRNKQVMTSESVYSNITQLQTFVADGVNNEFVTEYPIGIIESAILNGTYLDVATTGEREMGITADLYYTPKENVITLEETPASSSVLIINYRAFVNGRTVVYNSEEIARINANTDRKGVIARYENRNDAITTEELTKVGKSYLKYKGKSEITLTIKTQGTDLFNVGQRVTYNAPLEELSQEYMVKSKKTTMYIVANEVFYEYTLSSSFNSEDAINYFDNQRFKILGNIADGETITRNIDVLNDAMIIFDNLTINEVELPENANVLDFELDGKLEV
jgi:hypothetical protein